MAFLPHLTTFLIFSASLFMTTLALKDRKRFWPWMPLSIVTGILQMFLLEYFVGLEILRPVLIWIWLKKQQGERK